MSLNSYAPVTKSGLVHEFEETVDLLCDEAIVVHHLSTVLGKVNITAQGKTLGDGGRESWMGSKAQII